MRYLRTNTATIVTVGPFLDKTDGVTLETALTITNERISFTVDLNDGNAPTLVLDNVTGATSGTSNDLNYITNNDAGLMQLELAAANVNYLGRAFLTITDAANHCPVFHEFTILPAMVYDSLIAGTDVLQADMTQILGTAVSSPATAGILDVNLKNIANAAVSTSTAQLGVNAVQAGATAWGSGAITAGSIATGAITNAKFAAGAIDAAAIANAAIDNATFAADVGSTAYATNIIALAADKAVQNAALATAANLATLTGYVDTEVAAIKTKTDFLPSATAGSAGGVFIAGTNAATSITTALTANITGNLSGSVGSVTGAVGSVTGAVGSVTGAVGSVTGAVGSVTGNVGGSVASVAANGITATSIAADAINAAAVKADAVTKIQNGLATPTNITAGTITTVTNLTNAPTAGDLTATMKTSVTTAATAATPTAAAVTGAVGSVTAPVTAGTVSDKTGYALSSAGVQAIWDALTSALTAVGSVGKRIADNLDAAITSRGTSTYAGGDTSGTTTLLSRIVGTLASGTHNAQSGDAYARIGAAGAGLTALGDTRLANLDATVSSRNATTPPTVGAIADQVWDEAMVAHATPGTSGAILIDIIEDTSTTLPLAIASIGTIPATSAIANAVWDEALSGHATSGTAGKKLTDLANADLSGVATASALATLAGYVDTEVAAILADTNELQTDLVNGGRLDLLIDAIKAKTDNLPTDPADQSAVEAAITAATSPLATSAALTTVAGYIDTEVASILAAVDTEVAAIKAKTDNLPASPAAVGSAMTLTAAYDAAKTAATQTSVDDLPTNAELATALGTADDATLAAIAALNNLSSAQAQAAATAALNAYDPPTNTEMEARTLVSASYATATALDAVDNFIDTEVAAIKAVTDKLDTALVFDGAVYQLTANALELAPTGSGSGASAQEVWEYAGGSGRTINSVSGSVGGKVLGGGSDAITGIGASTQLADGVVHGGTTAKLTLKTAVLNNLDNQGIALSLRGGNPASPGHAIALLDGNGTLGTGRIRGYIDGVVNGVALATEAITDAAFDATGLQAVADALKLAPTAGDPATGSVYDLLVAPASEPAQLDWRAWSTPSGALAALYDTNAIDDLTHSGTTLTAEGDTGFAAWVLQEFDGKLLVGVGKTPMNHIAAVVGSIASAGETPTFEYALPEEGVAAMCVSWEDKLYVAGVDERANTGDSSIYIRTAAGTWTRKATVTGWQHICGIRHDGALWIAGQGAASVLMVSSDDGDTWLDTDLTLGRAYDVIRLGSYVIATHWNGVATYTVHRSPTTPAFNWSPVAGIEGGYGRMVEWEGVIVGVTVSGALFTVNSSGTGTEYTLPFTPRQTYNNLVVDTGGYLCVLGTTGVWRTNDLATWKQVWSFSPADTVRSLGTWGDNLVVSTDGATAQVLARPASPEAAQQQMYRDALKLAASPGTAATGSTDADLADILTDTAAIKAITDDIDVSAVTLATGNNAGDLTFIVGATFDETLTGLTVIPDDWTACYFSLKRDKDSDSDVASLIQVKVTNGGDVSDGLLYVQGSAPTSPITKANASLTVTQAAGTVRIVVSAAAMALLTGGLSSLDWDLKVFRTGGWSKVVTNGNAQIAWTPTRAI